jgi:hypothetical protein
MGLVESHPTISIKCCTSKKDIVRHMTQHSNNDEDHHSELRGIRNFVVSNKALTSVVSVDMKRPNRQSLLDYQDRIRCKIARQFASAPNELSIVHITDENSGEVLGLIRIESASKTKEVTLSILLLLLLLLLLLIVYQATKILRVLQTVKTLLSLAVYFDILSRKCVVN